MSKVVGKLRATLVVEWEVEDLYHYNAKTMEQAAAMTQKQFDDGDASLEDVASWGNFISVKIEVIPLKKKEKH